jgi:hypothetical protein
MLDHRNRRVRELWRRHGESEPLFGTVMAVIAMLFIAGIIGAFIYAMDTNPVQTAGHQPTTSATAIVSPPSASPSALPAVREPETTGSGGINRVPPKQDPRENEQSERP